MSTSRTAMVGSGLTLKYVLDDNVILRGHSCSPDAKSPLFGKDPDAGKDWGQETKGAIEDEGNGAPLQYSCLENPRDGGTCWAAVYGVAQSQTRLKRLSSSSSRRLNNWMASRTQWRRVWANSGDSEGQGSLAYCSPWGGKESDMT